MSERDTFKAKLGEPPLAKKMTAKGVLEATHPARAYSEVVQRRLEPPLAKDMTP